MNISLDNVKCANCEHILNENNPIFSRILAKYFGFCYDCMQDYASKYNSSLDKEKIKLAKFIHERVQNVCEQQIGDLFPTFLMQKAFQEYLKDHYVFNIDLLSLYQEKERFYGKNFEQNMQNEVAKELKIIGNSLTTLVEQYNKDIENLQISNNQFYNEGLNFGKKVFYIMEMNRILLAGNQKLDIHSFDKEQILNDLKESILVFENTISNFLNEGFNIINNTSDLLEKKKIYCIMLGVMNNIHGVTMGMLSSNPSGK